MKWALIMLVVTTNHGWGAWLSPSYWEEKDMGHFDTWKQCHVEELKHDELHDKTWCKQILGDMP